AQAVLSLIRSGARAFAVNAFPAAAAYYERGLQLLSEDDPRRPHVLFAYARALFATADDERETALERARTALVAAGEVENAGEAAGRREIERGVELALATNQLAAAARGYLNLAATADDFIRALEPVAASEQLSLRLGDVEEVRWARATRASLMFAIGRWDEARPLVDAFIADCDAGKPHYLEAALRITRAWAGLARDDTVSAI